MGYHKYMHDVILKKDIYIIYFLFEFIMFHFMYTLFSNDKVLFTRLLHYNNYS